MNQASWRWMTMTGAGLALACCNLMAAAQTARESLADDPLLRPIGGTYAEQWAVHQNPVHVFGNTWLIGSTQLNVALIQTDAGLIIVDAGIPQLVRDIEANIRSLGYKLSDVKYILSTEPHYDHAGGAAALARDTGAVVLASNLAAAELEKGVNDAADPQKTDLPNFPAVGSVRRVQDGERIRLGNVEVTAYLTPGHTAGSMSWGWQACAAAECYPAVFAASLSPISADGYRFRAPEHQPIIEQFNHSYARFRAIGCEILLSGHPAASNGEEKLAQLKANPASNPYREPDACKNYAAAQESRLQKRLATEDAESAKASERQLVSHP